MSRHQSESAPSSPSPPPSPCGSPVVTQRHTVVHHSFIFTCLSRKIFNTCRPTFLLPLWCHLLGYRGTTSLALEKRGSFLHAQVSIGSTLWSASYLDGLPEAALPQHLSVDEVRRAEDSMRAIGHDAERL